MILEQLATAGVQQAHKEDRIAFAAVTPWPGAYICAEGRYVEGKEPTRRSEPASSWAQNSARCHAQTSWWRRARQPTPASTC